MAAGYATLEELETTWSLDDLYRCAAVIEVKSEVERSMIDKIPKGKR